MTNTKRVYSRGGLDVVVGVSDEDVVVRVEAAGGWTCRAVWTARTERQARRAVRKAIQWVDDHEAAVQRAEAIVERVLGR